MGEVDSWIRLEEVRRASGRPHARASRPRRRRPRSSSTRASRLLSISNGVPVQKAGAIGTLVEQLDRLERWIARELGEEAVQPPLAGASTATRATSPGTSTPSSSSRAESRLPIAPKPRSFRNSKRISPATPNEIPLVSFRSKATASRVHWPPKFSRVAPKCFANPGYRATERAFERATSLACDAWPLRAQCTSAASGHGRSVQIAGTNNCSTGYGSSPRRRRGANDYANE